MRKIIGLLCVLIVLCTPVQAFAVDMTTDPISWIDSSSESAIEDIAVLAFPEYAGYILGEISIDEYGVMNRNIDNHIVCNETRQVSEDMSVTFALLSNNVYVVTVSSVVATEVSSSSNGMFTLKTVNLAVKSNIGGDVAFWDGINCVLAFNAYDNISSAGSQRHKKPGSYSLRITDSELVENASRPAYIEFSGFAYILQDEYSNDFVTCTFDIRFEVGKEKYTVSITNINTSEII